MSVEIWPHIAPEQLKVEENATLSRELSWLVSELQSTLKTLKSSLEQTYALLAPIDPGSTLVVSTPRQEAVKGHVTRVGTRLVKGTIQLRLKTLPQQTLALNPANPIHIPELTTLNALLTQSVDILSFIVSESSPSDNSTDGNNGPNGGSVDPRFLSSQLRLLSEYLAESLSLIKGPAPTDQVENPIPDTAWTGSSVPPTCFSPPLPANVSFYLTLQDASLVLYLRTLEPADAPVAFGTKFALAIGTARRLEHDEADRVFAFCPEGADAQLPITASGPVRGDLQRTRSGGRGGGMGKGRGTETQVFVREKVRVESADPSLMSLSAKLGALSHTLALARRNLAVVMGDDVEIGV